MLNILYLKILFYLAAILVFCLLPVYLFRKKWTEVAVIAGLIIYFFIFNKDFIIGKFSPWHDTMCHKALMTILNQWVVSGIPVGWNPYMNGGEPLYMFTSGFLWTPWIVFSLVDKWIGIGSHVLFNLYWVFIFLNFCIGGFLLFLLLFKDFRIALFCFIALLLGGEFKSMLGQTGQIIAIYYLPFILFGFLASVKYRNIYGILFSIVFFGITVNHYLPHYVLIGAGVFIFFVVISNLKLLPSLFGLLKSKFLWALLALCIFFVAVLPFLSLYSEKNNFVSPTRGSLSSGVAIDNFKTGAQKQVNAPFSGYRMLLGNIGDCTGVSIHHAFYIGILPLLLLLSAFGGWRNKYMWAVLFSIVAVALLGMGFDFWGYRMLIKYVPTFNIMRHSFQFSYFVSFYLICLSGFGLRQILREDKSPVSDLVEIILILVSFLAICLFSLAKNVITPVIAGLIIFISLVIVKNVSTGRLRKIFVNFSYLVLLMVVLVDFRSFHQANYKKCFIEGMPVKLEKITYPLKRSFFSITWPLPPDVSPLVFKIATLTYDEENYVFFRDRYLNEMLRFLALRGGPPQALGVDTPIFYFTKYSQVFSSSIPKEVFFINIFADCYMPLNKTRKVFFSEKDIDFSAQTLNDEVPGNSSIEYTKTDDPNRINMNIDAPANGFLVRQENFHRYWKAFIDGKKTKIYRANYAFQAIRMPAGKHKVAFNFNSPYPLAFWLYVLVCSLTWLAFNFYLHKLSRIKSEESQSLNIC